MKSLELTLRTFLIILVVVLTLQIKPFVPIEKILVIYIISIVVALINMVLFKMLGLINKTEKE